MLPNGPESGAFRLSSYYVFRFPQPFRKNTTHLMLGRPVRAVSDALLHVLSGEPELHSGGVAG